MKLPGSMQKSHLLFLLVLCLFQLSQSAQKSLRPQNRYLRLQHVPESEVIAGYQVYQRQLASVQKRRLRGELNEGTSTALYQKIQSLILSLKSTQADSSRTHDVLHGLAGKNTTPTAQKRSKSGDTCLLLDPKLRNLSAVPCLLSITNSSVRSSTN